MVLKAPGIDNSAEGDWGSLHNVRQWVSLMAEHRQPSMVQAQELLTVLQDERYLPMKFLFFTALQN